MKIIGDGGHAKVIRDFVNPGVCGVVIAIGDNKTRKRVSETEVPNAEFAVLRHPTAWISPTATLGAGTVVMAGAIVQAGVVVGKHCILNTGCSVDHDCVLGDYVHIAPGAHLCGGVKVGDGALVGVGSCAVPQAQIAPWTLVKAGTVAK